MNERQKRITASLAYSYYTYSRNKNPNWEKKLQQNYFFGNTNTQYGKDFEGVARDAFRKKMLCTITKVGLMVHPEAPWLGCSVDGLISNGQQLEVLEIKCPVLGQTTPACELVQNLTYINRSGDTYTLKHKHQYYG